MLMEVNRIRDVARQQRSDMLSSAFEPPRSVVETANIPEEIKAERRWVCWVWHLDKSQKWTKVPIRPSRQNASTTGPKTWSTFDKVCEAYRNDPNIAGIGFVLGDGWSGVDLDCCVSGDKVEPFAAAIIAGLDSYTEVSPTGTGVKILVRGTKPKGMAKDDRIEAYDWGRYFTITGRVHEEARPIRDCRWEVLTGDPESPPSDEFVHAINSMRKIAVDPGEVDGSKRLVQYARQAVRCGLDCVDAVDAVRSMLDERPTPKAWTDDEILARVEQADRRLSSETKSKRLTLGSLLKDYPDRRPELITGLLRRGEVMNVIAAPKEGKSWLMYSLALSVSMGLPWLGHDTTAGGVLLVDNELHPSELSYRLGLAAEGLFVDPADVGDNLLFEPLRGSWPSINEVDLMLERNYANTDLSLIVLDAYYRLLPGGVSENDNSAVTAIFNQLDKIAARHNCSIALVHHASKGDQSAKAVTDVGSGAGALTRAADTHVIIRPHEDDAYAVLEAVCRSHQKPEPKTLRFDFPLWHVESDVTPQIAMPRNDADRKQERRDREASDAVLKVLREEVEATKRTIRDKTGMSHDRANRIIKSLLDSEQIQITREEIYRGRSVEMLAILEPLFTDLDSEQSSERF